MEFQKDLEFKQDVIDLTAWPSAHEDLGKVEPLVYGADVLMPALRVDWGARTPLVDAIDDTQTTGIE